MASLISRTIQRLQAGSPLRPILSGVLGFLIFNLFFTLGVTFSPLNQRFNFRYGNFLPAKLQTLRANSPESVNVLFLGTSQTNNGFIPSVFDQKFGHGVKSFNVGLNRSQYDIMLAYLRFHQQRFAKPQWLMIEVSPSIQEQDDSFYYLPALYYRTLIEQAPSLAPVYLSNPVVPNNVKKELLGDSFSSLRQYRNTFSPVNLLGRVGDKLQSFSGLPGAYADASARDSAAIADETPPAWVTDEMLAGGWYPKPKSPNMKTPEGLLLSVEEARKYYIEPQKSIHFGKLSALLTYCQSQGIPVTLVTWPNYAGYRAEFERSALHQPYQQGLARIQKEYGLAVIDLNRYLPAGTGGTYFADPRHLTPEGARMFSEKLAFILNGQ